MQRPDAHGVVRERGSQAVLERRRRGCEVADSVLAAEGEGPSGERAADAAAAGCGGSGPGCGGGAANGGGGANDAARDLPVQGVVTEAQLSAGLAHGLVAGHCVVLWRRGVGDRWAR